MITRNYLFGRNKKYIYQDDNNFKMSLDSVLIGNFVTLNVRFKKILDIGCGTGAISLILAERENVRITSIDIQGEVLKCLEKSLVENGYEDKILVIESNILNYAKSMNSDSFDIITCNPPYFDSNNKKMNKSFEKRLARHEDDLTLSNLAKVVGKLLKNKGSFFLVQRADRFLEIIRVMKDRNLELKRVKFIYSFINVSCKTILCEFVKNGNVGLNIEKPMVVHNQDGSYSNDFFEFVKGDAIDR